MALVLVLMLLLLDVFISTNVGPSFWSCCVVVVVVVVVLRSLYLNNVGPSVLVVGGWLGK